MKSVAARLVELIHADALEAGAHLPAQKLADRLRVSRSPVNEALALLHEKGIVSRERDRGYFLAKPIANPDLAIRHRLKLTEHDTVGAAYFRIADDRLRGKLPDEFSEAMLKSRYGLTSAQLSDVLARIANEGWAEKKPGYGWAFSPMLTTPDSLEQSYRLRIALEPAALLEPGYRLDPAAIERCRAAEQHLLDGGIETDSADAIHARGVRFHETIVGGSGNPFFIDTLKRINRVRRLLAYRSMRDRKRYRLHCNQHLEILKLLERERNGDAAAALRTHLETTLANYAKIRGLLAVQSPRLRKQ
jgi:DNA-binding GntR family transcriptional regulator